MRHAIHTAVALGCLGLGYVRYLPTKEQPVSGAAGCASSPSLKMAGIPSAHCDCCRAAFRGQFQKTLAVGLNGIPVFVQHLGAHVKQAKSWVQERKRKMFFTYQRLCPALSLCVSDLPLFVFIPPVNRTNPMRHEAVREVRNALQKACCLIVESRC